MRKFQGRHPSSDKILEVEAPNLVVAKKMNPSFTDWQEVLMVPKKKKFSKININDFNGK